MAKRAHPFIKSISSSNHRTVEIEQKTEPKAVVQDGSEFRIYTANRHLGDYAYLLDTVQAPVRCKTDKERREWFKQTLLAKSLGDYEFS